MIRRGFFVRDPITCARDLIGCELIWGACRGVIVETEAYLALGDEAAHTFSRPSARRFVEERRAGDAYVYFNYGVHWMLNVLVKGGKENGFVLFRAIEPQAGLAEMEARRKQTALTSLCSGPGKLAQALGITGADHGRDLCAGSEVGFREGREILEVEVDLRVGISKAAHFPWRFLAKGSRYVSVRAGRAGPRRIKPSR